jgi:ABC-type bacteriocin/lantibiotic exporter with double-glycine peptidase domain
LDINRQSAASQALSGFVDACSEVPKTGKLHYCLMSDSITIRSAHEHNLKNISIELPRGKMIVIISLSGAGKGSLAFDAISAEGLR